MRWFHLLLISLLTLAQVHLCDASYVLPSGQTCLECPQLFHEIAPHEDASPELDASHGDCHDCCSIRSCDDHERAAKPSNSVNPVQFLAVLPNELVVFIPDSPEVRCIAVAIESAPPTGPPSASSPRAPPAPTNSLTSAGRGLVAS